MTRRVMAGVVTALIVSVSATVFAHMKMARSLPAAASVVATKPGKVQMWFTQEPDKAVSRITLTGPSGNVKLGAVTIDAEHSMSAVVEGATPDGSYTVAWQAAGDDGHVQKGEFAFTVRQTH